jgi:protein MAK16
MIVRQRKLKISDMHTQETMEPINKRYERREANREAKALTAAKLENAIEKELLSRLQAGTYKDIYNLAQEEFNKALDEEEIVEDPKFEMDSLSDDSDISGDLNSDFEGGEDEMDEELEAELEAERQAELMQMQQIPDSDSDDLPPQKQVLGKRKPKGKGVSLEYEKEFEEEHETKKEKVKVRAAKKVDF